MDQEWCWKFGRTLTREQLERTRALMNLHVRDCLITNYEDLISSLTLPDPDDRHVLAAAILGRADVIVTFNLADFPRCAGALRASRLSIPDDFIVHLLDFGAGARSVPRSSGSARTCAISKIRRRASRYLEARVCLKAARGFASC